MLGKLAKWLRAAGFDAAYTGRSIPVQLADMARREGRVLLTRNTKVLARDNLPPHLFIVSDRWEEQMVEVARAFGLDLEDRAFARCLECNVGLEAVEDRTEIETLVPEFVFRRLAEFHRCPVCRKVFWAGTHMGRMEERLKEVARRASSGGGPD